MTGEPMDLRSPLPQDLRDSRWRLSQGEDASGRRPDWRGMVLRMWGFYRVDD